MHVFARIAEGVFVARRPIVVVGRAEIEFVKAEAARVPRRRARLCLHRSEVDRLHEMVIALDPSTYVRPHRHPGKSESFHVIEGTARVVVFDEAGGITDVIALGARRNRLYRLDEARFHTVVIGRRTLVLHEITNGPFDRHGSQLAPFAPPEEDEAAARAYQAELKRRIRDHRSRR